MDIAIKINSASAEVFDSLKQMERLFDPVLQQTTRDLPSIEGVRAIRLNPTTAHPLTRWNASKRASLHQATQTYFVPVLIDYVAWTSTEWRSRLDLFGDALLFSVASLPKTRFSPAFRDALGAAISHTRDALLRAPPVQVAPVQPIFLRVDTQGKPTGLSFDGSSNAFAAEQIIKVAPEDAAKYIGSNLWAPQDKPRIFKLYLRDSGGRLLYREAWRTGQKVIEHWGECGNRGEQREHAAPTDASADRVLKKLKQAARNDGYRPISPKKMKMLIVEYRVVDFGSQRDLERRHALENYFDEMIGWLGLGHLDGGSIGSGSMDVALLVVDFDIARKAIEWATRGKDAGEFNRIYLMR